jgi:beta-lactamase class A
LLVGSIVAVAILVVSGGVAVGRHLAPGSSSIARGTLPLEKSTAEALPASPPAPAPIDTPRDDPAQFATDLTKLIDGIDADVGLVVSAVGSEQPIATVGEWRSGPAWSTIKVPLAIAALREENPAQITEEMTAAITRSDTAAAESIWRGLGDPLTAAHKVEELLREAGDPTTVESQRVRPEFTAFGQTEWSLSDQAQFLTWAACDVSSAPVVSLMGQVESDQRWGLGVVQGAQIKGGWGPGLDGTYLARQIGVISTPRGMTAVAMAVATASGGLEDGTAALTQIATWLKDHVDALPAGHCS